MSCITDDKETMSDIAAINLGLRIASRDVKMRVIRFFRDYYPNDISYHRGEARFDVRTTFSPHHLDTLFKILKDGADDR